MYGGFDTITSACRFAGRASNHRLSMIVTFRAGRPIPARFARATARASGEMSVIQIDVLSIGSSVASDRPIAPEPVPRSITVRAPSTALANSMATPATSSVSGRGISTRSSTKRSRCRNAHRPRTYCSGSPVRYRPTMASRCATMRSVTSSSRASSTRSTDTATSTSHRA